MVYGEARPYLIALIVINSNNWCKFMQEIGVRTSISQSLSNTDIEQNVLQRITNQIQEFPGYAKIRRVLLLEQPWDSESDLLTPTLKIKRNSVVERFSKEIEQLFIKSDKH